MKETDKSKKGRRPYKGKPRVQDKEVDERKITDGSNDVHWYGSDDILHLAGNLSFFKPLGSKLQLFTTVPNPGTINRDAIPGLMFIDILDTLPQSSANPVVDAINVAAKQQYALIRKANSGAKNYEWNDLIVYEMARSSLNQIYAFLCRAYGVSNTYSMLNKYLPRALLTGMGFDADDFISNLASIRLYINNLGKRINSLALPHSLSYFERKAWIYSHVFTDAASAKAQYYIFNPSSDSSGNKGCFMFYDVTSLSTGGCLRPVSIFNTGNTFAYWKVVVDSFVDALLADDDAAIISGDILKAYGDAQLFTCNPIPEDFTVQAVCDYEVLSQIENLTVAPNYYPHAIAGETDSLKIAMQNGWIVQDGAGNLLSGPTFQVVTTVAGEAEVYQHNPILNFHKTDVTPADVMVGTRLTTIFGNYHLGADNNYYIPVIINGTEVVTRLRVIFDPASPSDNFVGCENINTSAGVGLSKMFDIAVFDWAPKLLFYFESGGSLFIVPPFGDYEMYRILLNEELSKLHETATLNMFAVPLIQNYAK